MAALMAGMGEEWVLKYARQIKEQDPVWFRGNQRAMSALASGELAIHQMTFYQSCVEAAQKRPDQFSPVQDYRARTGVLA